MATQSMDTKSLALFFLIRPYSLAALNSPLMSHNAILNGPYMYELTRIMDTYAAQAKFEAADTWLGFKQLLPLSFFVGAFGLAFGLAAAQEGLSDGSIALMSALVFAGTSQFAALDMWGLQVPLIPLMITTFAINARHLLMGATLYPWLRYLPPMKRYGLMLFASDANWAMAMQGFYRGERALGILFGGGLAIWSCWMLGTSIGLYFGSAIEDPFSIGLFLVGHGARWAQRQPYADHLAGGRQFGHGGLLVVTGEQPCGSGRAIRRLVRCFLDGKKCSRNE